MNDIKNGLAEAIRTRRSTRVYLPDPVPNEIIEEIVEAGRLAPSASNNQTAHFIVITSSEKLTQLRDVVTLVLSNTPIREGMPPQFVGIIKRAQQGPVDVCYGATALVIAANKKGYVNAMADCACALQNMMLTATVNGVGNCWINQYRLLGEAPPLRSFLQTLGLQDDEEVCGALAMGYTDNLEKEPLPRNGNQVTYIR